MSKIVPNTTQTPNLYLDRLLMLLDEGELKTLLYAVRRTLGFHKGSDRISTSQFMNGNGHRGEDGELVEYGTGLTKSTQLAVLERLTAFGLLVEVAPNEANKGIEWALQLDERKVQWDVLRERYEQRKEKGRSRTKRGRVAASAKRQQGGLFIEPPGRSNQQTTSGSTIRPPVVQPLDHQAVYPLDPQKKDRKPVGKPVRKEEDDPNLNEAWGMLLEFCEEEMETAVKIWQLQTAFSEKSKIPRPNIDSESGRQELKDSWWPTLREVLQVCEGDLARAIAGLAEGIASQSEWKADSISTPTSVRKKTLAKIAAMQRVASNGNGQYAYATYTI
jgi:hypothetical protein